MKKSLTVALALSAVVAFGLAACKKPAAPDADQVFER